MIRIMINWNFISPSLQTAIGIVDVHYVDDVSKWESLTTFQVNCEPGTIGYKSLDNNGIDSIVFGTIKPHLDIMVRSFQNGIILSDKSYVWIMEEEQEKSVECFKKIHDCTLNERII